MYLNKDSLAFRETFLLHLKFSIKIRGRELALLPPRPYIVTKHRKIYIVGVVLGVLGVKISGGKND